LLFVISYLVIVYSWAQVGDSRNDLV